MKINPASVVTLEAAVPVPSPQGARLTILVIDDEAPMRELLRMFLERAGHAVLVAADGAAGREIAFEQQPDMIFCDVQMPGLSGHQVLEMLRSHYETRHIPFVFLTASGEKQSILRGMAAGAADYLQKPFRSDELDDVVAFCRRKQLWLEPKPVAAARCA